MAKLLAIDLDGTLFYPKQKKRMVPKKNIEFLRDFIDAGNRVVLCTSRSKQFVDRVQKEIDREVSVMSCTSSQIFVGDKMIRDESIDKKDLIEVFKFLDDVHTPLGYLMTTKDYPLVIYQNKKFPKIFMDFYHLYYKRQGPLQEPYIFDNNLFKEQLENGNIYKVMIFYGLAPNKKTVSKELNKLIREKYPNIESSWTVVVNELTPVNCNKADGLEYYCKHEGIDEKDVYVIGDSGNDISMFTRFHENSFVMAHAYPSVKKYAKNVVSRVFNLRKFVLKGEKE